MLLVFKVINEDNMPLKLNMSFLFEWLQKNLEFNIT